MATHGIALYISGNKHLNATQSPDSRLGLLLSFLCAFSEREETRSCFLQRQVVQKKSMKEWSNTETRLTILFRREFQSFGANRHSSCRLSPQWYNNVCCTTGFHMARILNRWGEFILSYNYCNFISFYLHFLKRPFFLIPRPQGAVLHQCTLISFV